MENSERRATQKALAQFDKDNALSEELIFRILEEQFPGKYNHENELYIKIRHYLFKHHELLSNEAIAASINILDSEDKLYKWSFKFQRDQELEQILQKIRKTISKEVMNRNVKASEFPEWNDEMRQFIMERYNWSCFDDDGKFMWGMSFYKQFHYYDYVYQDVPFHCYSWDDDDVLFSQAKYEWDETSKKYIIPNSGGCLGMLLILIFLAGVPAAFLMAL